MICFGCVFLWPFCSTNQLAFCTIYNITSLPTILQPALQGALTWIPGLNSSGCSFPPTSCFKNSNSFTCWENICTPGKLTWNPLKKWKFWFRCFFLSKKNRGFFRFFLAISFAGMYIYTHGIIGVDDHPLDLGMVGLDRLHLPSFEGVAGVRDTLFRGECLVAGLQNPVGWLHTPHHGRNHNQEIQIDLVKHVFMVKMLGESVRYGMLVWSMYGAEICTSTSRFESICLNVQVPFRVLGKFTAFRRFGWSFFFGTL